MEMRFLKHRLLAASVLTLYGIIASQARAHDFTWDNLAFASMKLNSNFDIDAHVDWYMQKYRPETWKLCHDDEFTYREKFDETKTIFQKRLDAFKPEETFSMRGHLELGDYDFEKEEFPISFSPNAFWSKYEYSRFDSSSIASQYNAYAANYTFLQSLKMPRDAAKAFVTRRKGRNGSIDRTAYIDMHFRIRRLKGKAEFDIEVLDITFYDDSTHRNPLAPTLFWSSPNRRPGAESSNDHVVPAATASESVVTVQKDAP